MYFRKVIPHAILAATVIVGGALFAARDAGASAPDTTVASDTVPTVDAEPLTTFPTPPYKPAPQVYGDCRGFTFNVDLYHEPVHVTFTVDGVTLVNETVAPGFSFAWSVPPGSGLHELRLTADDGFDYSALKESCPLPAVTTPTAPPSLPTGPEPLELEAGPSSDADGQRAAASPPTRRAPTPKPPVLDPTIRVRPAVGPF